MKAEDLSAIRIGAEIQSIKPYMDNEINGMQKAIVSFILAAVNTGTLTSDIALSKWIEYVSYTKLSQKLDQRIRVGQSVGSANNAQLDIKTKLG